MLAGLIDGAVGIDTEGDTHEVESALPAGTPDRVVSPANHLPSQIGSLVQDQMA